ncbi:MAG: RNA methyltransferase [Desulfonatronovibrionaceae bacterium]
MSAPAVILCRTKYPENIGSAARACANMGCREMVLVAPNDFDPEKAAPLATSRGMRILEKARRVPDLEQGLCGYHDVYATTARIGGWRKGVLRPDQAAREMLAGTKKGKTAAVVFGPEDTGLTNREVEMCGRLICIPTVFDAWSLNISQAVLLVLYEYFKVDPGKMARNSDRGSAPFITHSERRILYFHIQKALLDMDYLHPDNPDYFMMAMKRFLDRIDFRRNEFDLLMGVCRQIGWLRREADKDPIRS